MGRQTAVVYGAQLGQCRDAGREGGDPTQFTSSRRSPGGTDRGRRFVTRRLLDSTDALSAVDRSPNTVKKLWQSIYARVEAVDPRVLNPNGVAGDEDPRTRGPEKRRHLLDYLRYHLEELRPRVRRARPGA